MTRIDTPLELTSLRDDDPTPSRYRPSGSTLPTRVAAVLAIAAAALAAGDANSASVGPGRFVLLVLVIAWCAGALVTSLLRPGEPLAAPVAIWCIAVRPDLPVVGLIGLTAAATAVGLTGYVSRCRKARTQAARA